eukprot:TRINITY_DN6109_c0_g1_i2.p1 TRINITY_DN6109_c0_g1~~TRINITY_DN6109_c0_g1_i2.p1  ORF type:complete len:809 (+),score=198.39 TRINITY_DN6109_c0_g1_i2:97-2523(+)
MLQASSSNANSLKKRLRQAAGDVRQILSIVSEAERLQWSDQRALGDFYAIAMNSIGPLPLQTAPDDYGELCVKRLQVLCNVDPQEARTFNSFLVHYGIRQEDMRLRQAVAALGRESVPSALAASSPPAVRETREAQRRQGAAPSTGRGSNTPIRPRELRYSGCDTSDLEEAIAVVAAGACFDGEEDEEDGGQGIPGLAHPTVPRKVEAALSELAQEAEWEGTGTMEFTHVSNADNLSPIPEDRAGWEEPMAAGPGVETPVPPGATEEFSDHSAVQCEVPLSSTSSETSGGKLPKTIVVNGVSYTRLQTLGRGGSSKVYQVRSPTGALLALKRVTASCPKHLEALANEVTLLRQLKDCQNVIQVFDAEVLPDRLLIHIVMEEGQMDLGRLLQDEAELTLGDLQALWRQMLEAVQVIHNERIVHSDLKPGNFILVGKRLKLIDFGIAKRIASNTTNISRETSVGTISYMAPEAVKQGAVKIGRPSDIWSLGIILYQMVYAKAPFAHLDPMQRLFALTDPNMSVEFPDGHRFESHSLGVKEALNDVLRRCLQRDPRKRPSIPELLEHPFLAADSIRLSRAAFDRTMEALVTGFFTAAEAALSARSEEPEDQKQGLQDCWQLLSDEVWQRLVQPGAGQQGDGFSGLGHFKEWLARGASKRQRLACPVQSEKVPCTSAQSRGACASASPEPRQPAAPAAPRPAPTPAGTQVRPPLAQITKSGTTVTNSKAGHAALHAELLQKQRSGLRKAETVPVAAAAGKENVGLGHVASKSVTTAGFTSENLVLKRLKDRRALVADSHEYEEQTQITRWGH